MQTTSENRLKEGFVFRAATLDDVEAVVSLMNTCSLKVIGEADDTVEDIRADWLTPGADLERDQQVVVAPDGRIVGYVQLLDILRPMIPFMDVYVHPDYWGDSMSGFMMEWAEERAREAFSNPRVPADARVVMQAATYNSDSYYKGELESAGMQVHRVMWQMQTDFEDAPPAPVWPEGITVRVVAPDEDLRPILAAVRDTWHDHWGFVETPFEENYARWIHFWQAEGDFDRSLWFLAMDGDEIAGYALCKGHHAEHEDMGWVQTLGVVRAHRNQGLGMALLLHSFTELYGRGKSRVGLGVDAGSLTGATRLYQRAGMRITQQIEVYEKELRPGKEYRSGEE